MNLQWREIFLKPVFKNCLDGKQGQEVEEIGRIEG